MKKNDEKTVEIIEKQSGKIEGEQLDTRPGEEAKMEVRPLFNDDYPGGDRLNDKVALITGGDSGIGRAVALGFVKEGCRVAIVYLEEDEDVRDTLEAAEKLGGEILILPGDVGYPEFCKEAVKQTIERFGQVDILINNAAEQHPQDSISDISHEQLEKTFRTNIFSMFYMVQAALPYLKEHASIINTSSITAFEGSDHLIDYAATKGAITAFTRSLAQNLAEQRIRVNQVAPGPIWTPLIPSTFGPEVVEEFGQDTLLKRPGQPIELVEAYIYFAWERASSYVTGQTLHVSGGRYTSS